MNSIALIGRLILALALVLAVMWALARVAQKRGKGRSRGQALTVLARQSVSRNSSIAIVKVMDRAMVVGLSDGHVTLLGDTDLAAVEDLALPGGRPVHSAEPLFDSAAEVESMSGSAAIAPVASVTRIGPASHASRSARSAHRRRPAIAARTVPAAAGLTARPGGPLAGSALSPATWKQAVEAIREKTVRRA